MDQLEFTAVIKIRGINPYVLVSKDRAEQIKQGWRKPLPVLVRVNGYPTRPWRINMMPVGDGRFYLYLHAEVRRASSTQVGDSVAVELEFDADYRSGPMHELPPRFEEELDRRPDAKSNWRKLTPSRQKEILRYLANLKSPEVQARTLERAISVLSGSKKRFMARSWKDGA